MVVALMNPQQKVWELHLQRVRNSALYLTIYPLAFYGLCVAAFMFEAVRECEEIAHLNRRQVVTWREERPSGSS